MFNVEEQEGEDISENFDVDTASGIMNSAGLDAVEGQFATEHIETSDKDKTGLTLLLNNFTTTTYLYHFYFFIAKQLYNLTLTYFYHTSYILLFVRGCGA